MGHKAKINKLIKQFPEFAEQFPEIPSLLYKSLQHAADAKQRADMQQRELTLLRLQIETNQRKTVWAMLLSAIIISVAVLLQ